MAEEILSTNSYGSITLETNSNDLPFINVNHSNGSAKISLYGGHILSWQPKGQKEVFWLSDTAEFEHGKAIRGGIPICWPWFGPNIDDTGVNGGNHGFARNQQWQLGEVDITEHQVTVNLVLTGEHCHHLWLTPFKLQQKIVIGKTLDQQLSISNLSDHPVRYSSALHSYFLVSHPEHVQVPMLSKAMFDDKLTNLKQQQENLNNCTGPIDRIYYNNQPQYLIDNQWQRKILINVTNCHQWVLWNPGKETAGKMSDVHLNGENEFVCLEAANTQWIDIAAGETEYVAQHISIESIT